MSEVEFTLNHRCHRLEGTDPAESLLRWLHRVPLTGTKEGCGDGDCGACTVALLGRAPDGGARWEAVNSCLLPMGALAGREVLTVEALAGDEGLHPVQQAMVQCAGSQCGYCTPGFVMSLFVAHENGADAEDAIEGNLCRCTGYRPIRAAAAALPASSATAKRAPRDPGAATPQAASLHGFHSPTSLDDALSLRGTLPGAIWIAGATDLGVELSRGRRPASPYIALDRIAELQRLVLDPDAVHIGAAVSLSRIETQLRGLFPALDHILPWFAARQVRNRATLGGNLGSASPIGDLLPVLLALDARLVLRGPAGARSLDVADFFLDYRRTARAQDELIETVSLPRRGATVNAAYKVAKRATDDISIVAAAFALERAADGTVQHVRLAYGGVAAIPARAREVEDWLHGRRLDSDTVAETQARLCDAFSPLDDHRAAADYRRALCGALFGRFVAEHAA